MAYCLDEACAYIAEMMDRRKLPKFEKAEAAKVERSGEIRTTNTDVIHEILKETGQE